MGLPTTVVTTVHVVMAAGDADTGVYGGGDIANPRAPPRLVGDGVWGILGGEALPLADTCAGETGALPGLARVASAPRAPSWAATLSDLGGVRAILDDLGK